MSIDHDRDGLRGPKVIFVRHPEVQDEHDPVLTDKWNSRLEITVWIVAVITLILAWVGLNRFLGAFEATLTAILAGVVQTTSWSYLLGVVGKPASASVRRIQRWLAVGAIVSTSLLSSVFAWYALAWRSSAVLFVSQTVEALEVDWRRLSEKVIAESQALPIVRDGAETLTDEARREEEFGGISGLAKKGNVYNVLMREARRFEASAELIEESGQRSTRLLEESRRQLVEMRGLLADMQSKEADLDPSEGLRMFSAHLIRIQDTYGQVGEPVLRTALGMIQGDSATEPVVSDKSKLPADTQRNALEEVRRVTDDARRNVERLATGTRGVRIRQYGVPPDEMIIYGALPYLPMWLVAVLVGDSGLPLVMLGIMYSLRAGLRREAEEAEAKRLAEEADEAEARAERRMKASRERDAQESSPPTASATHTVKPQSKTQGGSHVSPLFAALRAAKSSPRR